MASEVRVRQQQRLPFLREIPHDDHAALEVRVLLEHMVIGIGVAEAIQFVIER